MNFTNDSVLRMGEKQRLLIVIGTFSAVNLTEYLLPPKRIHAARATVLMLNLVRTEMKKVNYKQNWLHTRVRQLTHMTFYARTLKCLKNDEAKSQ